MSSLSGARGQRFKSMSMLGATVQGRGGLEWLNNDVANFKPTLRPVLCDVCFRLCVCVCVFDLNDAMIIIMCDVFSFAFQ